MNTLRKDKGAEMQGERFACCPACESTRWVDVGLRVEAGYRVHRCAECQLVFSDPMKPADSSWYASCWLYGLRESNGGAHARIPWHFAQALSVLQGGSGNRLLDVGCAEGYLLKLAQELGCDVAGLDFNPVSVAIARKRLGIARVYQCSVEEMGTRFPGTQFDVVTLLEVLEHTADPYETVRAIYGLLKPSGKLLLSVPGSRRWPPLFYPEVDAPPHHLTLWTEEALRRLLARAGFRVHSVRRKPLGTDDLGLHLKWRLHHAVRRFQGTHREEGLADNQIPINAQCRSGRARRSGIVRLLGIIGLSPLSWVLRFNPRAGGFTLFVHSEKV